MSRQQHVAGVVRVVTRSSFSIFGTMVSMSLLPDQSPVTSQRKKDKTPSLLKSLPKRHQLVINELMSRPAAVAPLEKIIGDLWDVEGSFRSRNYNDGEVNERELTEHFQLWRNLYPQLDQNELRTIVSACNIAALGVNGFGMANRIVLNDLSRLILEVSLNCRTNWLGCHIYRRKQDLIPGICLLGFAVRDFEIAQRAAADFPPRTAMQWDEDSFHYLTTVAVVQHDTTALTRWAAQMMRRHPEPAVLAMDECFRGIAERSPSRVAAGLQRMIDQERSAKEKVDWGVCYLYAHGMYRLAEYAAPELVTEFDITQGPPWDRDFHEAVSRREHPLEGLNTTALPPLLKQLLLNFDVPDYFRTVPTSFQGQLPLCDVVLTNVGSNPKKVLKLLPEVVGSDSSLSWLKAPQIIERLPVTIRSSTAKGRCEQIKNQLEAIGATIELMD